MDFIVNPFITLLTFLYSLLGQNMVLAIVVFTIIVRLLTLPLTLQQQRSSRAMQMLQPKLNELKERHKNDREKLAQEQMSLYREFGINPVGGCLPLLIQFPIFIALYQAIIQSLASTPNQMLDLSGRLLIPGLDQFVPLNHTFLEMNLTQAPNFGAGGLITVISVVLVGLVVLTTWVQFKVTMPPAQPTEDGKPNQAQAMTQSMGTVMPLMYGFFALSFSVGLSIYFIVSNLIGIAQYKLLKMKPLTSQSELVTANNAAPMRIEGKAKPKAPQTVRPVTSGTPARPNAPSSARPPRPAQKPSKAK